MADFGQFKEGGPTGSLVTPKAAVTDTSTASLLGGLSQIAQTGGSILARQEQQAAAVSLDANKRSYLSALTSITQAQQTGQLPKSQAQAMIRQRYQQGLASGELPADEIRELTSDFLDVGAIVSKGTEEEQQRARVTNAAVDAGWVKPTMSPEERDAAVGAYQDFQVAGDKIKRASEELNLNNAQRRRKYQSALGEMSSAYSAKFKDDTQETLQALSSGEISQEMAVQELNTQWETIQSVIAPIGAEAGGDYAGAIVKPMQSMYQNAIKVANGEMSREIYQNQSQKDLAMATANLSGDPKVAKVMALSKMLPNADLLLTEQITSIVSDKMNKNSTEGGRVADLTDPEDFEDNEVYLGIVKNGIRSLQSGRAIEPQETEQEVHTNLVNVIKGVGQYGAQVDNPSELNQVLNLLADSNTGQYIKTKGGVPSEVSEEAKIVFTEAYKEPAIQAVLRKFESGTLGNLRTRADVQAGRQPKPIMGNVEVVFQGSGVVFRPVGNVLTKGVVQKFNKEVAPVLNRLIRIDAHLEGSTDYAKTFRENYESLFTPSVSSVQEQEGEQSAPEEGIEDVGEVPTALDSVIRDTYIVQS